MARQTTFINGIDVVRKLEKYVADGRLKTTTKFITADVTDLYTMVPRQGALEALARFCVQHAMGGKIGTLTIDHIIRMARFTEVLANIYMLEWEQELIQYQSAKNETYGR